MAMWVSPLEENDRKRRFIAESPGTGKELKLKCRIWSCYRGDMCDCSIRSVGRQEYYSGAGRLMDRVRIHCFKLDPDSEHPFGCADPHGRTSTFLYEQVVAGRLMAGVRR